MIITPSPEVISRAKTYRRQDSHLGSAAQFFVTNETVGGVPVMVEFWNAGAMPNKLDYNMSSMSSTAIDAMNDNVQLLMQQPSGSSNVAGGDLCVVRTKVNQENSKGEKNMMAESQPVGDAVDLSMNGAANLLSATHPMYERPQVVDGPYAAIKPKKGQKGFDVFYQEILIWPEGQSTKT